MARSAVAGQINQTGGRAHVTVVDALDDTAVGKYLDHVVEQVGGIDVEFNAPGPWPAEYGGGAPAVDLPAEHFLAAQAVLTSQFITARGAADDPASLGRHHLPHRQPIPTPGAVAIGAAFGGIETLTRGMASS